MANPPPRDHAPSTSWICAQIGAREHYAIPRVLHHAGRLEALFTDYWSSGLWHGIGRIARAGRLTSRYHPDLSDAEIFSFNKSAVLNALQQKLARDLEPYSDFLRVGSRFGRQVRSQMRRRKEQHWENTVFFGYDTGFLEAAAWAKDRGAACIVCQMDPSRTEVEIVRDEALRWPDWAKQAVDVPEEYFAWRKTEWALADVVMVNSRWTGDALIQQGVPPEKIVVVPLAYESPVETGFLPRTKQNSEPLNVLFLGQVNIRKGIPYLIEAARLLQRAPIHIDVVGPIGIQDQHVVKAPSNIRFHGPVPRGKAEDFYKKADVFVLPTISDGFALTQLEAMAHGLPVIATPNCGDVVTDGLDGFLVPARDSAALARSLQTLAEDPERLEAMQEEALRTVKKFGLDQLGKNLRHLESRLPLEKSEDILEL